MLPWSEAIDPVADQTGFAGVVSVHRGAETEFARAYGLADRACQIPNTVRTRFAIASGTKGLTALAVVSLINDDALAMSTTARSVLGADLPLIGDDVTIEHLLAHRSGIGDYLDDTVILEGFDAGVSFRSVHDPRSALTCTVISNSSDGAWPITRRLDEFLAG
jgi:CubicO group peptidase (beta-lactamase class C family)